MNFEDRTKSDTDRLMQAISALSAAPEKISEEGRLLATGNSSADQVFCSLLTEVNETVLHRKLTFASEEGAKLIVEAAERRFLRMELPTRERPDSNSRNEAGCLTGDDAPNLYEGIFSFCLAATGLRVKSELPDASASGAVEGIACGVVWTLHALSSAESTEGSTFEILSKATEDIALACITRKLGGEDTRWGAAAECAVLMQLSEELADPPKASNIAAWSGGLRNDCTIASVSLDNQTALVLLATDALDTFLDLWRPVVFPSDN